MRYFLFLFFCFNSIFCLSQTNRAECDTLLLKAIEAQNKQDFSKSLEILLKIKNQAQQNNWYKQLFLSINNIGANYYMMLDYGEAIDYYLEAYKIALKHLKSDEEMIVLNNIAILYSKEKQFDKAEKYFLKAYKIAKEKKDYLRIGLYAINLANVTNEQVQVEQAKKYIKIALPLLKNNSHLLILTQIAQANNYYNNKEYQKAKELTEKLLLNIKNTENLEIKSSILMLLSKIYEQENNIEKAISYTNSILENKKMNIEYKKEAYSMMSQLYFSIKDYKKAILFKDSVIFATDSINKIKNGRLFENSKIKFEVQNFQQQLLESDKKLVTERKIFYSALSILFILLMCIFWGIRNHFIKLNQRKIIAERNEQITQLKLTKEKNNKLLLEKTIKEQSILVELNEGKLQNEIELKKQQLTSKILNITTRNHLIEDIIVQFLKFDEVQQNNILKYKINELRNHLQKDSDWNQFFNHFEEVNQNFLKRIKELHPNLNTNDLRFISYIYMNLSIKEISILFNITPEACRKRKERISKKMNLSTDIDLYTYLSMI